MLEALSAMLDAFSTLPIDSASRSVAIGTTPKAIGSVLHALSTILFGFTLVPGSTEAPNSWFYAIPRQP
jgi:hypothetical protein